MIDLGYIERRINDASSIIIDTETTGLDWRRDETVGFVLTFSGDPQDSHYLPVRHKGGGNLDRDRVIPMLRRALRRQTLRTVGFNYAFDLHFLEGDEIRPEGPLEDAQINMYLLDENQRSFSLDACCRFMGVQEKLGDELYAHMAAKFGGVADRKQMSNFHLLAGDDPVAVDYAVGDGTSTWQAWEKQQPELDAQALRPIWEIECRVIRVLHRMTTRGVRIDEERLHQVRRVVERALHDARARLPKNFNERAPSQLRAMFEAAGHLDWPITAKGNPSFAEGWLHTFPMGRDVVAVRKLSNLVNSFLEPLGSRHVIRGRVHCNYNQTRNESHGTITGRLSCSDPNLQQCPKRDEVLGPIFRSAFIPDHGMTWGSPDYSQIEPRLLAHFGQVRVLLDGYRATPSIDAHSAVATAADIPRQAGKTLNQALITGSGDRHAIEMLVAGGVDPGRGAQILSDYFRAMPEIKTLFVTADGLHVRGGIQRHASNIMLARGYLRSLLGRKARLDDPRFAYKALNRLLQCGNADVLKRTMVVVDDYLVSEGDQVHLLNNIHDSLDLQYPPELEYQYREALRLMADYGPGRAVELDVPLEVEEMSGPDWAVASYGEDKVRKAFDALGGDYGRRQLELGVAAQ